MRYEIRKVNTNRERIHECSMCGINSTSIECGEMLVIFSVAGRVAAFNEISICNKCLDGIREAYQDFKKGE